MISDFSLSVVIATLGRSTLEDAMQSALDQFLPGDELIIVRDSHGDPDDVHHVRERAISCGPHVIYLEHDAGRHYYGGTAQSNAGFEAARGDFILSLGDDDAYVEGALAKVRAALMPGRALIGQVFIPHNGLILPGGHYLDRHAINGCGLVVPREHRQLFPLSNEPSADFDWMTAILASTGQDPVWFDHCFAIVNASRRGGRLANRGPVQCVDCHRGLLVEDTIDGHCIVCRTPTPVIAAPVQTARPLRIAFVWPAAEMSVSDVARGYQSALRRAGHTLIDFKLHNRFKYHASALAASPGGDRSGDLGLLSREATDGIAAFVMRHNPDLVCIVSGMSFHPDGLVYLKQLGIPTVTIFSESPYDDAEQRAFADVYPEMICATQDVVSAMRQGWVYLPPAYDPAVHARVPLSEEFACDVFMVATGWRERQELIENVDWSGIDCRIYGHWPGVTPTSPMFRCVRWTPRGSVLLNNAIIAHAYASAKISLNIHRQCGRAEDWDNVQLQHACRADADAVLKHERRVDADGTGSSVNPRVIEVAACGGFLLTDYRPELDRIFAGATVPTFDPHRAGDLERQIRWWLAHPHERQRVAMELHKAVAGLVQTETFDARVRTLFEALEARQPIQAVA